MTSINDFSETCKTDVSALIPPVQIFPISRMVAYISHDLRQPLTAILANAELLAQPDLSEMERIEFFREIRWGVDRMDAMLSSLLKDARGSDTLMPAPRNIVHTVECAVRMIRVRR